MFLAFFHCYWLFFNNNKFLGVKISVLWIFKRIKYFRFYIVIEWCRNFFCSNFLSCHCSIFFLGDSVKVLPFLKSILMRWKVNVLRQNFLVPVKIAAWLVKFWRFESLPDFFPVVFFRQDFCCDRMTSQSLQISFCSFVRAALTELRVTSFFAHTDASFFEIVLRLQIYTANAAMFWQSASYVDFLRHFLQLLFDLYLIDSLLNFL